MEKSKFQRFLDKYNLGGSCESVLLEAENNVLSTRSISDDKAVLCEVNAPSMGLGDGLYGVYETARLKSLLGVLGETLSVEANQHSDRFVGITFADTNTDATFVLADPTVIPSVPDLKTLPPFDVSIDLTDTFINTFVKAKSALPDVDTFTVLGSRGEIDIVLGHSKLNTNRVTIKTGVTVDSSFSAISFSAKYLREILVANKEAKNGVLEISSKGLARVTFSVDSINSKYFLVKIDTAD
jgi:hypothetical protein